MIRTGFKHGRALSAAIQHVVSQGPAQVAVAYWGSTACERLRLPQDLTGYRIACDAFSGFCSPLALTELLRRKAVIIDVSFLHAKIYLSPNGLVATSANASKRGLSDDEHASFGLEAGIFVTTPDEMGGAQDWFEKLFADARVLGPGDMPHVEERWKEQRAKRSSSSSLMDAILAQSTSLADRTLKAYVYTAATPNAEIKKRYEDTPYFDADRPISGGVYPFFWGEMPASVCVGDELLCFEVQEGKVACEGLWRILDKVGRGASTVWPAAPAKVTFAQGLGPTREVTKKTAHAVRNGRLTVDEGTISLTDFAAAIVQHD